MHYFLQHGVFDLQLVTAGVFDVFGNESWNPHLFFSGADVVDWLFSRVEGFKDRRDARKYASSLLKHGYLRHTVNKITFSEQCYYTFGDLCQSTAASPKCA